jgi:hypothetical protein
MQTDFIYDGTLIFVHVAYKFTGKERDTEADNNYFGVGYYASESDAHLAVKALEFPKGWVFFP